MHMTEPTVDAEVKLSIPLLTKCSFWMNGPTRGGGGGSFFFALFFLPFFPFFPFPFFFVLPVLFVDLLDFALK